MGYPKYKGSEAELSLILELLKQLNPLKNEKEIKDPALQQLNASYENLRLYLTDLSARNTQGKDRIWKEIMSILYSYQIPFAGLSLEEKNNKLETSVGIKQWEFFRLATNIKNQLKVMELRDAIVEPEENAKEYQELSEMYQHYSGLAKDFDSDFLKFESYKQFQDELNETGKEEEKSKRLFEFYSKDPETTYIDRRVKVQTKEGEKTLNLEEVYDLYSAEYNRQKNIEENTQKKINECFDRMKKALKDESDKNTELLENYQKTINNSKETMASLTKNVLDTIEVGNIEAKLSGDMASIDEYFAVLDREIKDRPLIAIRKAAKDEKKYQLARKAYLEGLRFWDKAKDGSTELIKRIRELDEKYARPFGKTLDQQMDRVERRKKEKLESLYPDTIAADKAGEEFEKIKEDFIKLYTVYSESSSEKSKNFKQQVKECIHPSVFITSMINTVNNFPGEFLDTILVKPRPGKLLTVQEDKINTGCIELNQYYSQMKATVQTVKDCENNIKLLNEQKIDPALFDQKKVMDSLALEEYAKLGIKPDLDLQALFRQMQDASVAKGMALKGLEKYEPLREAYLSEKKYVEEYMHKREEATTAYNKIKGTTARMTAAHIKAVSAFEAYKPLQIKSNALKEKIMNSKNASEKSNADTYKDILSEIASNLKGFVDSEKVGRSSVFKDSKEYTDMINSIKNALAPQRPGKRPALKDADAVAVKEKMDGIVKATKAYLTAKSKQWRLFPSYQRRARLAFANNLLTSAKACGEKILAAQAVLTGVKGINAREYEKAERDLAKYNSNINTMEEFFTNVVKPRVKTSEVQKNAAPKVEDAGQIIEKNESLVVNPFK